MLQVRELSKAFGSRVVFQGVSFEIGDRERTAIVGANGTGKSTLLKIISGGAQPDGGQVSVPSGGSIGYLPQEIPGASQRTVYDEALSVFSGVLAIEQRQRELERQMAHLASEDSHIFELAHEHTELQDQFERLGGYTIEAEIGRVLDGLGFRAIDRARPLGEFSGGWQMRVALAKLLLQHPDILLLDEPTNHLDLPAVEWLEDFLSSYPGAVVIVSHDRYFLDRLVERTLELENGSLRVWSGNYSKYVANKAHQREVQESAYMQQQAYLHRQREFVERFRADARRSSQARSREKLLSKMDLIEAVGGAARSVHFRFPPAHRSAREVFRLKALEKRYGDVTVFSGCNLLIERGDRLALIGPNGAGKSTLLRLLAGEELATRGSVIPGQYVERSYYSQNQADSLNMSHSVLDEVYAAAPSSWPLTDVRSMLGRFLFTGDDVFKLIGVLSGGERARVALAKMLLKPANVLLLDEPTNHLDVQSREVLEDALLSFDGTIILASHDRYLVDKVATKVVEIDGENVVEYAGNYSFYRSLKAKLQEQALQVAPAHPTSKRSPRPQQARMPKGPSIARQLEQVEQEIMQAETEIKTVEEELARPDLYADPAQVRDAVARFEEVKTRLATLNSRWEELVMLPESSPDSPN